MVIFKVIHTIPLYVWGFLAFFDYFLLSAPWYIPRFVGCGKMCIFYRAYMVKDSGARMDGGAEWWVCSAWVGLAAGGGVSGTGGGAVPRRGRGRGSRCIARGGCACSPLGEFASVRRGGGAGTAGLYLTLRLRDMRPLLREDERKPPRGGASLRSGVARVYHSAAA